MTQENAATSSSSPRYGRREFLRRAFRVSGKIGVGGGALTGLVAIGHGRDLPRGARGEMGVLRPPNSRPEAEFLAECMRCTLCADVCEPQCIRLFGPEAGASQGTPYILPVEAGCTMCMKCGPACPTGAIEPMQRMEETDMGVAVVDERLCVSHNGTGICGACHTMCPLHNRAITLDYRDAPTVHAEVCTGCGLCEEVCIVDERSGIRAIQVQSKRRMKAEA
ncbi:MAG: 4Fe-4S dicluster domain-containing protein [Verrucomicrobia bacterium]|nr:4Fe-4S dicluster domain-containing protein [Verrucomicrobiota bacterium]MDA1086558.1 4Fe-4S dicluster domain-containing protein [Verrucomicrobiota bacterium]